MLLEPGPILAVQQHAVPARRLQRGRQTRWLRQEYPDYPEGAKLKTGVGRGKSGSQRPIATAACGKRTEAQPATGTKDSPTDSRAHLGKLPSCGLQLELE